MIAGVAVVAMAVIVGVWAAGADNDDEGLACTLAPAGVGLISAGLARNRSSGEIIAGVGASASAGLGCKKVIETFVEQPEEVQELRIAAGEGSTATETVTGSELAAPPPPLPYDGNQGILNCLKWNAPVLVRLCANGDIDPPGTP